MPKYRTKKEKVYYELRDEILHAAIAPGSKLTISGLAAKFGVSEIPVREGVQQLVQEGYLSTSPHKGITVSTIREEDVHEIFQVRIALESLAARSAVKYMSNIHIEKLSEILERSRQIRDGQDYAAYWNINHEFHNYIYSFCGNKRLIDIIAGLMLQSNRFPQNFYTSAEQVNQSIQEHRKIVDALLERDEEIVETLTRLHTIDGYKVVLQRLRESNRELAAKPTAS